MLRGVSLGVLIRRAYRLSRYEMSGGPSWIESDPFDIVAQGPIDASREQTGLMLRTLIADRFKLVMHTERRALPVYTLVRSQIYNGLGPRLVRSTRDCAAEARLDLHATLKVIASQGWPLCGDFQPIFTTQRTTAAHSLAGTAVELSRLAIELPTIGAVDRTVLDQTGLTGTFDFTLWWTPQPENLGYETDPPSIVSALERQLGLALESTNEQIDVLVIDRAEHPTGN